MKPTVSLILTHKIRDNSAGSWTKVTAVFDCKNPTNSIPNVGHTLWFDIWEDNHQYGIEVDEVRHILSRKNVWEPEIILHGELEAPSEFPADGTMEELVAGEIEVIENDIWPRLKKQGFEMIFPPSVDLLKGLKHKKDRPRKKK